jgi:hypothetical protein
MSGAMKLRIARHTDNPPAPAAHHLVLAGPEELEA